MKTNHLLLVASSGRNVHAKVTRCVLALCLFLLTPSAVNAQQESNSRSVSQAELEELSQTVAGFIQKDWAVGAELLVIQNGKTLLHKSYGYSDRDDEREWTNDTVCNIRSMTKPITSAAAQILIDQGKLDLDAPVAQYLPSFDNEKSKAITVRQVLTHRSGLPLTNLLAPFQYESLEKQVAAAGEKGPAHEPGSKFWYSDIGTDTVGRLIEKVSGEPLDQFVAREILSPLGMDHTFYGINPEDKRLDSVASLYLGSPQKWNRFWKPGGKPLYPFAWGSQTIYSTTSDYARFVTMLMNRGKVGDRQLLSEAAIDRMLAPISEMKMMGSDVAFPTGFRNMRTYYGQMMVTYRDYRAEDPNSTPPLAIGHSGSDGTNAWAWPELDLVAVYFTQSRGGKTPLSIEAPIDLLLIHGGKPVSLEDIPAEFRPLLGTYLANFAKFENETFTVSYNGKLVLDVPSQMPYELLPRDADGFYAFAVAPDSVRVSFVLDDAGVVTGLKMHQGENVFDVPRAGIEGAEKATRKMENSSDSPEQDADLPSADEVLKKYIAATGGEDAYRERKTQHSVGTISIPAQNISGTMEIIIGGDGKYRSNTNLGNLGSESSGSDGETVWTDSLFTGASILEGAQKEQVTEETDLQARLHTDKYFENISVKAKEDVDGDPCYRVEFTTKKGETQVEFYSIETGLLTKQIKKVQSPAGQLTIVSLFSDYRTVDKFNMPFHTEQKLPGDMTLVIEWDSIKVNEEIADETFELPENVRALLK